MGYVEWQTSLTHNQRKLSRYLHAAALRSSAVWCLVAAVSDWIQTEPLLMTLVPVSAQAVGWPGPRSGDNCSELHKYPGPCTPAHAVTTWPPARQLGSGALASDGDGQHKYAVRS